MAWCVPFCLPAFKRIVVFHQMNVERVANSPYCLQTPVLKNVELQHGSLQQFFASLDADIVCMQETKLVAGGIPQKAQHVPGFESFWSSSKDKKGYSGCATFVRLPFAASAAYTDSWLSSAQFLKNSM